MDDLPPDDDRICVRPWPGPRGRACVRLGEHPPMTMTSRRARRGPPRPTEAGRPAIFINSNMLSSTQHTRGPATGELWANGPVPGGPALFGVHTGEPLRRRALAAGHPHCALALGPLDRRSASGFAGGLAFEAAPTLIVGPARRWGLARQLCPLPLRGVGGGPARTGARRRPPGCPRPSLSGSLPPNWEAAPLFWRCASGSL